MILVLSVDGKSPGWIFAVCIWNVAGLTHLGCGNEGISLVGTNPPAVLPPALLYHSCVFFPVSPSSRKDDHPDPARSGDAGPRPR